MKGTKKRELFKEFLGKNKVLIVDKSSASRRRLTKTLVDMGCSRQKIFPVAHFSEAMDVFEREDPKLVLSDFKIQGGSGFDLFQKCREEKKKLDETTLVLVTSNISQSSVAKAAEEDVDSFIIKPYTVKSLEKSLVTAVINKLYPSEYMKTIDAGKEKMFAGEYEQALELFTSAISMNKSPSLAYFYKGQAQYFLDKANEAKDDYEQGLAVNKIHFKCQVGLFELFIKEKKYFEAYDVVKNIAKYFPANPERLKQVVRLAVMTENYLDLMDYYEIFTTLEERSPEVVNYVCSGLYVLGRYEFFRGNKETAKEAYEKLLVSCMGEAKFLRAVIGKYVEENMYSEAQAALKRYPAGSEGSESHSVSKYLANSGSMSLDEKISGGLDLFNKGFKDLQAVTLLIDALFESGSNKARRYLEEARLLWPDEFQAYGAEASA